MTPEEELVREVVVSEYAKQLLRAARAFRGMPVDPQDITQDAAVKALKSSSKPDLQFSDPEMTRRWYCRVVASEIGMGRRYLRTQTDWGREARVNVVYAYDANRRQIDNSTIIENLPDPDLTQEEKVILGERYADALEMLPRLTKKQRQAVSLFTDGLGYAEIATHLGVSEGAVKMLFFRIRKSAERFSEERKSRS